MNSKKLIGGLATFVHGILGLFVALFIVNTVFSQGRPCKSNDKIRIKYEIAENYKTDLPPYIRTLRVVVEAKYFNDDDMQGLANALRTRFCTDKEITAMIFDNMRVAKKMDEAQFLMGRISVPEVRGFYTLTNAGKKEFIEYSKKRGNPTNEVLLEISP
jgi:hypothetical protein